jgi:hypothetical protein
MTIDLLVVMAASTMIRSKGFTRRSQRPREKKP